MIFVITFCASLGTILGAYWYFVLRLEDRDKASIFNRLKTHRAPKVTAGVVLSPERLSQIPWLESLLSSRTKLVDAPHRLISEAGLSMTVGTFLLSCFVGGAVGWFIAWQVVHMLAVALLLSILGAALPYAYVRFKRTRRLRTFEEQFPEAMDLISRALRAGHAFSTGIGMVADEIPAPVGSEFRRLHDEQNFGMSLPVALKAMAERVPILDARFFVTAVLTQRESGGNLSEVLDNLASVMRDRFKLKRQIRVVSAHGRMSAWVLAGIPPVLAAALFTISPTLMSPLFTDPMGVRLVIVAVTLQVVGTIIISRMVRIEY